METYKQSYSILASDMDITYHITPNAILLYFQDCFARSLSSRRLAAFDIIKDNLLWVISEFDLHLVNERPLWSSDIDVEIIFREISAIRIYVDYRMSVKGGEDFAVGTSTWVVINSVTKRPSPAKEMLEKGGITASGKHTVNPVKPDTSTRKPLKEVEHAVNVTDLDFNGHVCNRSYLSLAMSTFPVEFIKVYSPEYMHIKFAKEAFFGETLTCKISEGDGMQFWSDIENEKGAGICQIFSVWKDNREVLSKDVSELIPR